MGAVRRRRRTGSPRSALQGGLQGRPGKQADERGAVRDGSRGAGPPPAAPSALFPFGSRIPIRWACLPTAARTRCWRAALLRTYPPLPRRHAPCPWAHLVLEGGGAGADALLSQRVVGEVERAQARGAERLGDDAQRRQRLVLCPGLVAMGRGGRGRAGLRSTAAEMSWRAAPPPAPRPLLGSEGWSRWRREGYLGWRMDGGGGRGRGKGEHRAAVGARRQQQPATVAPQPRTRAPPRRSQGTAPLPLTRPPRDDVTHVGLRQAARHVADGGRRHARRVHAKRLGAEPDLRRGGRAGGPERLSAVPTCLDGQPRWKAWCCTGPAGQAGRRAREHAIDGPKQPWPAAPAARAPSENGHAPSTAPAPAARLGELGAGGQQRGQQLLGGLLGEEVAGAGGQVQLLARAGEPRKWSVSDLAKWAISDLSRSARRGVSLVKESTSRSTGPAPGEPKRSVGTNNGTCRPRSGSSCKRQRRQCVHSTRRPRAHLALRGGRAAGGRLQRAAALHHLQRQRRQLADVGLERLVVRPACGQHPQRQSAVNKVGGSPAQPWRLPARPLLNAGTLTGSSSRRPCLRRSAQHPAAGTRRHRRSGAPASPAPT